MGGGHRNGQLRKAEVSSGCRKKREPLQARERRRIGSKRYFGTSGRFISVEAGGQRAKAASAGTCEGILAPGVAGEGARAGSGSGKLRTGRKGKWENLDDSPSSSDASGHRAGEARLLMPRPQRGAAFTTRLLALGMEAAWAGGVGAGLDRGPTESPETRVCLDVWVRR